MEEIVIGIYDSNGFLLKCAFPKKVELLALSGIILTEEMVNRVEHIKDLEIDKDTVRGSKSVIYHMV